MSQTVALAAFSARCRYRARWFNSLTTPHQTTIRSRAPGSPPVSWQSPASCCVSQSPRWHWPSAFAAVCVVYTFGHLGYKSSRLDLLNPKSDHNRLWIEYVKEFGDEDDAVVVVEGAGRDQVVPVLEELSAALGREKRLFHAVLHEVDLSKIRAKGLHYVPADQLQGINRQLDEAVPIVTGDWSRLQVGKLVGGYAQMLQAAAAGVQGVDPDLRSLARLDRTINCLLAQFSSQPHYESPLAQYARRPGRLERIGHRIFRRQRRTHGLRPPPHRRRQRRIGPR